MIWAHYFLQVNLYLVLFYCFYKILLEKETYFTFNRMFLVGSAILSLVIPFLRIQWFTQQEVAQPIYISVDQINRYVGEMAILPEVSNSFAWGKIIILIYFLGISVLVIRFFFQLILLNLTIREDVKGAAFSFFKVKKVDKNLPDSDIIDAHENLHVKQYHSFDILFFEILCIVFWFNPVVYFYKIGVKNIHEYLADQEAANLQGDKDAYSLLLLSKTFNVDTHVFLNNFYTKSMVKKRIAMLYKKRSKRAAILKYGLFVPLFGFALILSSSTVRENKQLKSVSDVLPNNVVDFLNIENEPSPTKKVMRFEVSLGEENFGDHVFASIANTPIASEALSSNLIFGVKNGKLIQSSIQSDFQFINKERLFEILRNYQNYNTMKDGHYVLPIIKDEVDFNSFILPPVAAPSESKYLSPIIISSSPDAQVKTNPSTGTMDVLTIEPPRSEITTPNNALSSRAEQDILLSLNLLKKQVESEKASSLKNRYENRRVPIQIAPAYPGGMGSLQAFITKNIKYPENALNNNKTGVVLVNFIVEKDGTIDNIHVNNKVGFGLDEEAMRVIAMTDHWQPATQNGKQVRVVHQIPVIFKIAQ